MHEEELPRVGEGNLLSLVVRDRSDEEILALCEYVGGVEPLLDLTFDAMCVSLDPAAAEDAVVGYEIVHGETTYAYALVIRDGTATYEKRPPDDARVVLSLSVPDYLRLVGGELDGMTAFMQGRLRVRGDLLFAQRLPSMFRSP